MTQLADARSAPQLKRSAVMKRPTIPPQLSELERLWKTFMEEPFPREIQGETIDGVDVVLLDTSAAGCIESFVKTYGRLDLDRIKILQMCMCDLNKLLPHLDGEELGYFMQLKKMSELVLQEFSSDRL